MANQAGNICDNKTVAPYLSRDSMVPIGSLSIVDLVNKFSGKSKRNKKERIVEKKKQKTEHNNFGIMFEMDSMWQLINWQLKIIQNYCILSVIEQTSEIYITNPSLLNTTVMDFCNAKTVKYAFENYFTLFGINNYVTLHNSNKGYDFPENFETENIMRVHKDFVCSAIYHLYSGYTGIPSTISYSKFMKKMMCKMSNREFLMLKQVFQFSEDSFKLETVLAALGFVGLFVIFHEYQIRNKK